MPLLMSTPRQRYARSDAERGVKLLITQIQSHAPHEPRASTASHAGWGPPGRTPKGIGKKRFTVVCEPQDGGDG